MDVERFVREKVHTRTCRYMQEHDCTDYRAALHSVLDSDPQLKQQYAGAPIKTAQTPPATDLIATRRAVADEVHRLTTEFMVVHGVEDYAVALRMTLADHPELAKRYVMS